MFSERPRTLHRRASSLMEVGQSIARMISGTSNEEKAGLSSSVSSNTSSFILPSSFMSTLIPESSSSTPTKRKQEDFLQLKRDTIQEEEDEDSFDFTKVIEIGKNVKTFSEGIVGNSIRMLNDVATQIKTTIEEENKKENLTQYEHSSEDDNEWIHQYL